MLRFLLLMSDTTMGGYSLVGVQWLLHLGLGFLTLVRGTGVGVGRHVAFVPDCRYPANKEGPLG